MWDLIDVHGIVKFPFQTYFIFYHFQTCDIISPLISLIFSYFALFFSFLYLSRCVLLTERSRESLFSKLFSNKRPHVPPTPLPCCWNEDTMVCLYPFLLKGLLKGVMNFELIICVNYTLFYERSLNYIFFLYIKV